MTISIAPILLQLLHSCLLPSLIFLIKFKSGSKDSKHLEEKKCLKPNTVRTTEMLKIPLIILLEGDLPS